MLVCHEFFLPGATRIGVEHPSFLLLGARYQTHRSVHGDRIGVQEPNPRHDFATLTQQCGGPKTQHSQHLTLQEGKKHGIKRHCMGCQFCSMWHVKQAPLIEMHWDSCISCMYMWIIINNKRNVNVFIHWHAKVVHHLLLMSAWLWRARMFSYYFKLVDCRLMSDPCEHRLTWVSQQIN